VGVPGLLPAIRAETSEPPSFSCSHVRPCPMMMRPRNHWRAKSRICNYGFNGVVHAETGFDAEPHSRSRPTGSRR
jgi:hypothetical protein